MEVIYKYVKYDSEPYKYNLQNIISILITGYLS